MTAENSPVPLCCKLTSPFKVRSTSVFTGQKTWFERARLTFMLSRAYSRLTSVIDHRPSSRGQWRVPGSPHQLAVWSSGMTLWEVVGADGRLESYQDILFFHSATAEKSHVPLCCKPTSPPKLRFKSVLAGQNLVWKRARLTFTVLSRAFSRLHTSLIHHRSFPTGQWRH